LVRVVEVVVTVTGEYRNRIEEVADALRVAGLQAAQVLGEIGQVTGRVSEDRLRALRTTVGVQSVDRSGEIRIGPPDSPVQ
jgi:hypothetical protein